MGACAGGKWSAAHTACLLCRPLLSAACLRCRVKKAEKERLKGLEDLEKKDSSSSKKDKSSKDKSSKKK